MLCLCKYLVLLLVWALNAPWQWGGFVTTTVSETINSSDQLRATTPTNGWPGRRMPVVCWVNVGFETLVISVLMCWNDEALNYRERGGREEGWTTSRFPLTPNITTETRSICTRGPQMMDLNLCFKRFVLTTQLSSLTPLMPTLALIRNNLTQWTPVELERSILQSVDVISAIYPHRPLTTVTSLPFF